jgi:hypothetical protein
MQIGPSIAIYLEIVFVRYLIFKKICFLSVWKFSELCLYLLLDPVVHVCDTWHGVIPGQNQNAWLP